MAEFSPGLEGVVAALTEVSEVDGKNGRLIYRGGYLIHDLAEVCSFEEVAHLLLVGHLPDGDELKSFKQRLAAKREMAPGALEALRGVPKGSDPMDALRTVLSAQGCRPGVPKPTLDDAIEYTAVLPTIVAAYYRQEKGQDPVEPRGDLDHAANFLYMMEGKEASPDQVRWLDSYLTLLADHGLNASTFSARVIASTGTDLCSALVGAVGALKGPAHGGAATAAMNMLKKVPGPQEAESFVKGTLDRHEKLYGFGHRVYRTYDPRAKILREMAKKANPEFYEKAYRVEEVALKELLERHPERPNATNVDYWASLVLAAAGFPAEYFTCVFAVSRVVGWSAHVLEYMSTDGRILRPASTWTGPEGGKKPAPLAERNGSGH
jgi:citrate synthase